MDTAQGQAQRTPPTRRSHWRRIRGGVFTMALTFGVATAIIWAKLRLVGDVPRTVYAEPERNAEAPKNDQAQSRAGEESAHDDGGQNQRPAVAERR